MESRPIKARQLFLRIFPFPVFLGAVLAGCVFYFANRGVADPDIWFHLRNAEYLLKTHHFIRSEMYSYTANGAPWINFEWLSEIPYYLAWRAWGLRGVFLVMAGLIQVVLLGTYYLGYLVSGNVKSAFLGSWVAMILATVSFGPRNLLFGWVFLIILLIILWRFKERGKDALWVLPPLFLIWINAHGSWLIGLVVFGIFVVSGLFDGIGQTENTPRWTPAQLKTLLLVAGVTVLALFINPYGYKLVLYPFDLAFRQNLAVGNVQEWASVDFHSIRGKFLLGSIFVVLIITILRRQRWRLEWFGLFLFAIYASVNYMRFLFFAGIIFTPILARALDFIPEYDRKKDKPAINALFAVAAIVFIVLKFPSESSLTEGVRKIYPVDAAAHLQSLVQHDGGRVLNEYNWGGYLILKCPEVPIFIDSRADVFEHKGIFKEYMGFVNLTDPFEVASKYRIRYALLGTKSAQGYLFMHTPGWHVVYTDDIATIFERENQNVVIQSRSQ